MAIPPILVLALAAFPVIAGLGGIALATLTFTATGIALTSAFINIPLQCVSLGGIIVAALIAFCFV